MPGEDSVLRRALARAEEAVIQPGLLSQVRVYGPGRRSYHIVCGFLRDVPQAAGVVLDATYGRGRFWRLARRPGGGCRTPRVIIGVDVARHEWEVEPDYFIEAPVEEVAVRLEEGNLELPGRPGLVVVDPPWSMLKRGYVPRELGYSRMPYHIKANPYSIIGAAYRIARRFNAPMLYRFMEPLPGSSLVGLHLVKVYGRPGVVYYGVVPTSNPQARGRLEEWLEEKRLGTRL